MDPDACLALLLDAFRDKDREAAFDAIEDLNDWLARGGFMPKDPRITYRDAQMMVGQLYEQVASLASYVSPDDIALDRPAFLRMVADRINDDLKREDTPQDG
jgi:hypothetical protein